MNISRRMKYSGQGHTVIKGDISSSQITLDNFTLDLMCRYVISSNASIRRGQLINLRNVIYSLEPDAYISDNERSEMVSFVKKGIDARLVHGLNDTDMILRHINGDVTIEPDRTKYAELTKSEVSWLGTMISESIKYGYLFSYADRLIDACNKIKSSDYGSKSISVREFEALVNEIQSQLRRSKNEEEAEAMFSLKDGFRETIREIHNDLNNPGNILETGMVGMNQLLGGGYEAGRCYIYFGLPGEGKSTTLLNICYQMKKHNRNYRTKDPTKIPCIVLLTMENKVKESVNRLFGVSTSGGSLENIDPDLAVELMEGDGELYLNDENPIDIIIKYKPTNSVDTSYLYTLTEDLEDEGYEVICMVQDYIGRIRSVDHSGDIRIEYGQVVDEMKVFANIKDIPVISASQLNRDASKHIDEARKSNKNDLVRLLGRSNVSESMMILNNCDGAYMLAPEYTSDGKKFLGVQKVKSRILSKLKTDYIYLPYLEGSEISLVEDIGFGTPLFKTSLRDNEVQFGTRQSPYHTNKIVELGQIVNDDGDNSLFNNGAFVSSEGQVVAKSALINPIQFLIEPIIFEDDTDNFQTIGRR